MENKQNIVEKRIKPGVIRRRAKAEEVAPEKVSKAAESTKVEGETKAETVKKKRARKSAPAEKTAAAAEQAAPVPQAAGEVAPAGPEADKKVAGPKELPEGPPVGTIIELPHMKKKSAEGSLVAAPGEAAKVSDKIEPPVEEEEDLKVRLKKPVKKQKIAEDEMDFGIEGIGRVSTLSQIARLSAKNVAADRVFQPTRTGKKRRAKPRGGKKTAITTPKAAKRVIKMEEAIVVSDLAQQLGVKGSEIIKKLVDLGNMATLNQTIDFDTATLLAQGYHYEVKRVGFEEEKVLKVQDDQPENLKPRAPVVTVMGHVDHGKTSLLDAIRSANVVEGEAGGITQHIGSYMISLGDGRKVTFLDTPGHEAFTAMRARGAAVTDIVILVVAADDGVMPQTIEAINHAKAAGVPIIVAVNKMDKPEANPDQVKRQLSEQGLLAEDWGGEVLFTNLSAKTKQGIDTLLENIFLQSEMLDLRANPDKPAKGIIIEARLDKGRGPVATALVQEGTLRVGDYVVSGNQSGKIRALTNDRGEFVESAGPGVPVEILGLDGVPQASDSLQALTDEKAAREVVEHRQDKARGEKLAVSSSMSLEELFSKMQAGEVKELPLVVKGDVQGSVEAILNSLEKLPTDKVKIRVLHSGAGGITESDIRLAQASQGIVIGFGVRPDTQALEISEKENVEIKVYKVIYDLVDDIKKAMEGLLEPTLVEKYLGRAEVQQVFTISKVGAVAGCKVVDGKIRSNANVRLLRDSVIVHEGKLSSLKRFKDNAKEVATGQECGMGIEGYNDIKEGDVIECFQVDRIKTKLE